MATLNHVVILLLIHNCKFVTVRNPNAKICHAGYLPWDLCERGCGPQVENHWSTVLSFKRHHWRDLVLGHGVSFWLFAPCRGRQRAPGPVEDAECLRVFAEFGSHQPENSGVFSRVKTRATAELKIAELLPPCGDSHLNIYINPLKEEKKIL